MKTFKIYFEFFGRKMRYTVEAHDADDAKYIIISKLKFHKIEEQVPERNWNADDFGDSLKDFLGIK